MGDAEAVTPDDIVAVVDLSPETLSSVVAHLAGSTTFEHFVFREAELSALWSLTGFALTAKLAPEKRAVVLGLRHAVLQAYEMLARKRPLEAIQSLEPFITAQELHHPSGHQI